MTAGPLWVFAALLALAGVGKLRDPAPTEGALRQSGWPSSRSLVQLLGSAEVVVGVYAIAFGDVLGALAVAAFYLGFTVFVANALVRDLPVASCGCFGKEDTPPTWIHVAITLLGATSGVWAAVDPPGGPGVVLGDFGESVVFLAVTGIAFAFAYISLTTLPKTLGAARRP